MTTAEARKIVKPVMDSRVRALLDDPCYAPNSAQLERMRNLPISDELFNDLEARHLDLWVGTREEHEA